MAAPSEFPVKDKLDAALVDFNSDMNINIEDFKPLQRKAINIILSGKDCICSLPTGYGKSLVYEILPYIHEDNIVLVIVPLNAIIEQQVKKLGCKAVSFCGSDVDISKLEAINFSYLFCHPEQALSNKQLNKMFCSQAFSNKNIFVVIDEAHCILDWGTDFRPDFQKLFQLRSLFKSQIIALSATVTRSGQELIARHLLMKSCELVCSSPAKDNITLMVQQRPSGSAKGNDSRTPYEYVFKPIIHSLKERLEHFKITIIYCKTMNWIGYGYELAKQIMGDDFYAGEHRPENVRVVMFHSSMEDQQGKLKEMILHQLQKPESECTIRLIFSSVALGMGADLKHVSQIIHAGPPTSLETYVHEIGRAGRSGSVSDAVLYYNKSDLVHVKKEMKEYCLNSTTCRRSCINKHFGFEMSEKLSVCCDVCTKELCIEWDFSKLAIDNDFQNDL